MLKTHANRGFSAALCAIALIVSCASACAETVSAGDNRLEEGDGGGAGSFTPPAHGDATADEPTPSETRLCVATECPAPYATCPAKSGPTYKCGADLERDPLNCGACGNECSTWLPLQLKSRCVKGSCELECYSPPRFDGDHPIQTDFRNCNGLLDDGCEVDILSDPKHCGACGTACAAGERCFAGKCGCNDGLTDCKGKCVDLQNDDFNCNACGTFCSPLGCGGKLPANTHFGCGGSKCEKLKCDSFAGDCNHDLDLGCASDGCEVRDLRRNPDNCGQCGNKCKPDEQCRDEGNGYQCLVPCAKPGQVQCFDSYCADLLNDLDDCGGCGMVCAPKAPIRASRVGRGCASTSARPVLRTAMVTRAMDARRTCRCILAIAAPADTNVTSPSGSRASKGVAWRRNVTAE
ncbi:Tryptophan synthase alpha chain [Labilithrix luteola]|uniref:Tryptophan synthase alpha chain n=1 Tax=Labilithrix luteola TaxID=1391654 RepID=A0A0K1QH55_9BACT|nr:hypothetical protein [Labilithrix luteola]AKV04760.1 Tryptophan synthase alpha chain [Labilithrix luteola]